MSVCLVATWAFFDTDTPDQDAMLTALGTVTDLELEDYADRAWGEGLPDLDDAERPHRIAEAVTDLQRCIIFFCDRSAWEDNDGLIIRLPGDYWQFFGGGDSGGDDPNEAFTVLNLLHSIPRLLHAGGMVSDSDF